MILHEEQFKSEQVAMNYFRFKLIENIEKIYEKFEGETVCDRVLRMIEHDTIYVFQDLYHNGFISEVPKRVEAIQSIITPSCVSIKCEGEDVTGDLINYCNYLARKYGIINIALKWFVMENRITKHNISLFLSDKNEEVRNIAQIWCKQYGHVI